MYLKSISLKGFKSFASATNLNFERGITCVVGPNGSGKSNVVDALSWVMGEQGAKSLRGGKMEDVIFAGTSGRAPLGRAEVSVTIDNSDGALPIEFTEVTITRILFRNGSSEYQINGESARLLDIQELLSDSGIGREMHVIVGQGQLDAILLANPEERRAFIEEAAGVLKHRKRKEKAIRKLDSMQGNLARIQDLTVELRRQLKPLGKQAEVARKAGLIQSDLRDARLRLLADELASQRENMAAEVADEGSLKARRDGVELSLHTARAREEDLERTSSQENPLLVSAQESYYKLTAQRERFRGVASLSAERYRLLTEEAETALSSGRDPEAMEAEAAVLRGEEADLRAEFDQARSALSGATNSRSEYEKQLVDQQRSLSTALAQVAQARESAAREEGRVASLRSKLEALNAELNRLHARQIESEQVLAAAKEEYALFESELAVAGADEGGVGAANSEAKAAVVKQRGEVENLANAEAGAAKEVASLSSRLSTLQESLTLRDGSEVIASHAGVRGKLAELIEVERGYEQAVAAALGSNAQALVVSDIDSALGAIAILKEKSAGRSELLLLTGNQVVPAANSLATKVKGREGSQVLVDALLGNFQFASDLAAAKSIARNGGIAVTSEGDVVGANVVRGGSQGGRSLIEIKALIEQTEENLAAARAKASAFTAQLQLGKNALALATSEYESTSAIASAADAAMAGLSAKFAAAGNAVKNANLDVERVGKQLGEANAQIARLQQELSQAEAALAARVIPSEPDASGVDHLRVNLETARASEVDAKLHLRTIEERANALAVRARSLETTAANERESAARAIIRREQQKQSAAIAKETGEAAQSALGLIEVAINEALAARAGLEQARAARDGELLEVRAASRELAKELEQLTSSVHKDEVMRAEQRMRIEALEARALEEFGIATEALIAEYGPSNDVPTHVEDEFGNFVPGELIPYRREQQAKRLAVAEKELALLGKINPLALEEYSALEERLKYLAEQLEDLKKTRKDLLDIVKEVDEKVQEIFTQAYADTAREFESIFKRLFPGGDGRLILTDPSDMTLTGVDVEARPPGKRVKRLSLLSGGERSLVAVAMLVAIFKARPSPFYVMDEVEAALDDTNLSRLLGVFEELREKSQLIVITHQKRTMEIADALYGVTMRGDGVSEVISQRLRESEN